MSATIAAPAAVSRVGRWQRRYGLAAVGLLAADSPAAAEGLARTLL